MQIVVRTEISVRSPEPVVKAAATSLRHPLKSAPEQESIKSSRSTALAHSLPLIGVN